MKLYRSLTLGKEIDLGDLAPVTARVTGKRDRQILDKEGYLSDLGQIVVLTITDVGGFAEPAAAPAAGSDDDGGDD